MTTIIDEFSYKYSSLIEKNTQHKFILELASGTLLPSIFRHYLLQDAFFLEEYGRIVSLVASRVQCPDLTGFLLDQAQKTIRKETESLYPYYKAHGIDSAQMRDITPSPTTLLYTGYLYRLAIRGTFRELLFAILPCFLVYSKIAQTHSSRLLPSNSYQVWFETYMTNEFQKTTRKFTELANSSLDEVGEKERGRVESAFRMSLTLELYFWEACYQREEWSAKGTLFGNM